MGRMANGQQPVNAFVHMVHKAVGEWNKKWPAPLRDNPDAVIKFLDHLTRGSSMYSSAALCGFRLGDINEARQAVPEFDLAVDRAMAQASLAATEAVMNAIVNEGCTRTAVRFLESHDADAWSPKSRTEVTGKDGGPIETGRAEMDERAILLHADEILRRRKKAEQE